MNFLFQKTTKWIECLPIPQLAPVTMTYFPVRSLPINICSAVELPSNFCFKSLLPLDPGALSSTANAKRGSVYVVFWLIWLKCKITTNINSSNYTMFSEYYFIHILRFYLFIFWWLVRVFFIRIRGFVLISSQMIISR